MEFVSLTDEADFIMSKILWMINKKYFFFAVFLIAARVS